MRVCVIGAGFAGLAAADHLASSGAEVIVLEARTRAGGRVWSDRLPNGALIERGGEFITGGYSETERACERLGLELVGMGIRYPERTLRPDPGIDRAAALAAAAAVESVALQRPGVSALDLLDDVVGDPAIRELFAARIQSSRAHAIDDLDARYLAGVSHLLADDEARRVRGGNQLIADRLAARIGSAVRFGTPARSVLHDERGVRVQTDTGEVEADAAVLALPAPLLATLPITPALPAELAAVLARLRMSVAAKLAVPLAEPVAPDAIMSVPGRFWAYATPCDEVGGSTASAWAGAAPVVDALRAGEGPEAWLAAVRELWPELPPTAGQAVVTTWRDDPWSLGAYSVRPPSGDDDDQRLLQAPVGRIAFAGEHTAGDGWSGTIEGALRSGARAAAELTQ
jgi:monoamine oxidase